MEIVINGVSGWIGRSTVHAVNRLFKNQIVHLTGISSRNTLIAVDGIKEFPTVTVDQYLDGYKKEPDVYVHLPFKTKDYQVKFCPEDYIQINRALIEKGLEVISRTKPKSVIIVSSGVVGRFKESQGLKDDDLYTKMKIQEEESFQSLCLRQGINLVTLRLWGASGYLMTEPLKYAIGDLVAQALQDPVIKISSDRLVYRRYIDASEVMSVSLICAQNGFSGVLNSGGTVVEMMELTERILSILGQSKEIVRPPLTETVPDLYFSTSTVFEEQARKFGLELSNLEKQILQTKIAVLRSLK